MATPFSAETNERVGALRSALIQFGDEARASKMEAYMKGHFSFLGIQAADRRAAQRPLLKALGTVSADELVEFADACWAEPEREFQYTATEAIRKHVKVLEARHLVDLRRLIVTKSWWDTVDSLAARPVGDLVAAHRELVAEMDAWIRDDDFWLARTAILHQLFYKEETDTDRLFAYADLRASDTEFFIRKAIGWALRQYARTDPDAVRDFVTSRQAKLSGLTKREAMKHL